MGKTVRKISGMLKISKSTVFNIIKRFKEGRIENKTKNMENQRKIKDDPLLSAVDLQKLIKNIKKFNKVRKQFAVSSGKTNWHEKNPMYPKKSPFKIGIHQRAFTKRI